MLKDVRIEGTDLFYQTRKGYGGAFVSGLFGRREFAEAEDELGTTSILERGVLKL